MMAEQTKLICEREHLMKAKGHLSVQQRITALLKDIPKTLRRAKYVFTVCIIFNWVQFSCV